MKGSCLLRFLLEEAIVKTLETTPTDATHWSTRSMAREVGLTQSAVLRITSRSRGLQELLELDH
jgi:DNA-binding MurR/RpiR family transcriptional regulator